MQAFINPSTGKVVLREVENYKRHGTAFSDLSKAIAGCGFEVGPALETQRIVSGNGGGNIETLPFGICLLGDDHFKNHLDWRAYATQICQPGLSNSVKVPTYWLTVGHTDEILKVVRNKSKPAPCDFSIAIASPRVAMELLATHKSDKFFEFSNLGYEAGKKGV